MGKIKKSENIKRNRSWMKVATTHLAIQSLIFAPGSVLAQQTPKVDSSNWASSATQIIQGVGNSIMKARQQGMMQTQLMGQMASMQPKMVPSKFFPHCAVAPAVTKFPENACEGPLNPMDQGSLQAAKMYQTLAVKQEEFFENMTTLGQNSATPVGIQCLNDAMKRTQSDMQDRMNSLQAMINKVKKQVQFFKEENQKHLDQMQETSNELYGAKGKDLKADSNSLMKEFSPNCRDVLGAGVIAQSKKNGLIQTRDINTIPNQLATRAIQNKGQMERDLLLQIQDLKKRIKEDGISSFDSSSPLRTKAGTQKFSVATGAIKEKMEDFNKKKKKIETYLKDEFGYDMPPLDGDFGSKMETFTADATRFFQKKMVSECVTGDDGQNIGLTADAILKGLRHTSAGGNALAKYKAALKNILNDKNAYMEDKLDAIKALDATFGVGNIEISYTDFQANQVRSTPYELYRKTIEACQQNIAQDNTFSANGSQQKSIQNKIAQGQKYLNEMKSMESSFAADIGNALYEEINNCSGRKLQAGACSIDGGNNFEMLKPDSGSFCISHAVQCGSLVNSCQNEMNAMIKTRQTKIERSAAIYNQNMTALIANQEQFLAQVKAKVVNDAEFIKNFVPGSKYQWPEDLFVKMPPMDKKKFGTDLRGGGDLDSLDDLPEKMGYLKDMMEQQSGELQTQIAEYIGAQKAQMDMNKGKWTALKDKCLTAYKTAQAAAQKMNADSQKRVGEQQKDYGEFCSKFNMLRENPDGFCGEDGYSPASLMQDATKITGALGQHNMASIKKDLSTIQTRCKMVQNEAEEGSEKTDSKKKKTSYLAKACRQKGSYEKVKKSAIADVVKSLPPEWSDKSSKVKSYLSGKNDDSIEDAFGKKLAQTDFAEELENLKSFMNKDGESTKQDYLLDLANTYSSSIDKEKLCEKLGKAKNCSDSKDALIKQAVSENKFDKIVDSLKEDEKHLASAKSRLDKIISGSGDDAIDMCDAQLAEALVDAASDCMGEKSRKCVESKYLSYKSKETSGDAGKVSRTIASITGKRMASEMGEFTSGACVSQADMGRNINSALRNFDQAILGNNPMLLNGLQR